MQASTQLRVHKSGAGGLLERNPLRKCLGQLFATICILIMESGGLLAAEPIKPLPPPQSVDTRRVALGQKLFFDKRFSKDNAVACVNCHSFEHGGADPRAKSVGVRGRTGKINSPTVFNSGLNFAQLWSGRATTLEQQIDMVVRNADVFDSDWPEILSKLSQDRALVREFADTYRDGMTARNIIDTLAAYQRALITPSRFDRFLLGDKKALSEVEQKGYERFKAYGCVSCHQGVNIGGNMYQQFGVMNNYFQDRGTPITEADLGRYVVTKDEEDKFYFKVPSLRNVAMTAPYFHDGSVKTLEEAVDVMIKYQLGRSVPERDKALIVAFLRSLTGTLPQNLQPGKQQ